MHVGERLKELRSQLNVSKRRLAKLSGVALSFINEIEKGTKAPTVATLERLCDALGITLADFFAPARQGAEPLQAELCQLLQDDKLRQLLLNAKDLTPQQLAALTAVIKAFK